MSEDRVRKLLRWYPTQWRQRYGDELLAMIDDTIGEERPTLRLRWSIARAGLRERGHASGLLGKQSDLQHQVRAGAQLVLSSWSVFIVAGGLFEKQSEHFTRSLSPASRTLATSTYDVIAILGIIGSLTVIIGAVVALPTFISFIRHGGLRELRRPLTAASLLSVATISGASGLIGWAHELSIGQRNGRDTYYSLAFVIVGLLLSAAIIQWTLVGVVAIQRMTLSQRVLRFEGRLAYVVTAAMVVITIGVILWWIVVGYAAPRFLGVAKGSLALTPNLVVIVVLMLSASLSGLFGSARMLHGWQRI